MAKLTKQQIAKLNDDINNGTILTSVYNSRYHFVIKINTEGIVIQSMLSDDKDRGFIINLADVRDDFDKQRDFEPGTDTSVDSSTCEE